ncbi:MAG: YesL family protein [Oscillospiraceae bacterium]|jgi:uncharacterized membrane protein YesL|nr:YesL family protein [Oscillospiraceae bacterium]
MYGNAAVSDPDNLWKFGEGLASVCILGMLWLVCSIPIVTIGASTTAMYTVFLRRIRDKNQKEYVKPFFTAFRQCFKQSTILWTIQLLLFAVLGLDLYYYARISGQKASGAFLAVFTVCVLAAVIIIFCYAYPLTALYQNTVKETLIESAQYAVRSWPWSLLALAVSIAVPYIIFHGLWYLALIAGGAVGIANSYIMVHALKKESLRGHGSKRF